MYPIKVGLQSWSWKCVKKCRGILLPVSSGASASQSGGWCLCPPLSRRSIWGDFLTSTSFPPPSHTHTATAALHCKISTQTGHICWFFLSWRERSSLVRWLALGLNSTLTPYPCWFWYFGKGNARGGIRMASAADDRGRGDCRPPVLNLTLTPQQPPNSQLSSSSARA